MTELTQLQAHLLDTVRTRAKGDEITGAKIANMIGLKPRDTGKEGADLRSIVNALRRKGYPICANGKGYYYPRTRAEINEYVESLKGRIAKETEALDGIMAGIEHFEEDNLIVPDAEI